MKAVIGISTAAALVFLGACATGGSGGQPNRYAMFESERFGYFNYEAGGSSDGFGRNWRPAEAIITIVTREGRPVTEADRDVVIRLARQLCEEDGREFNTRSRGVVLRRGGISFAGDCREW